MSFWKKTLVLLLVGLGWARAEARVYENVPDCNTRYGAPLEVKENQYDRTSTRIYLSESYLIALRLEKKSRLWGRFSPYDYNVLGIEYVKPEKVDSQTDYDAYYFGLDCGKRNRALTATDIKALLDANSRNFAWTEKKNDATETRWCRSDGDEDDNEEVYARYDKARKALSVYPAEYKDKWETKKDDVKKL